MYVFASQLIGQPIISLQTSTLVGYVQDLVINPDKLELIALNCLTPELEITKPILLMKDIRQIAVDRVVINSDEDVADSDDIVRLQRLLDSHFHLVEAKVVTESGEYVGQVTDYSVNLETRYVQRLNLKPPLLRRFMTDSLLINREQIIDVKPGRITVRDTTVLVTERGHVPSVLPTD